jgi:hypothetical protein
VVDVEVDGAAVVTGGEVTSGARVVSGVGAGPASSSEHPAATTDSIRIAASASGCRRRVSGMPSDCPLGEAETSHSEQKVAVLHSYTRRHGDARWF